VAINNLHISDFILAFENIWLCDISSQKHM